MKKRMNEGSMHRFRPVGIVILCIALFIPFPGFAQQHMAIIQKLYGDVLVSIQGQADIQAGPNMALAQGDIIQTQPGSQAVLAFSDGTLVRLGNNTTMNFARLEHTTSMDLHAHLYLLWGSLHLQEQNPLFRIETLNAEVELTFSKSDTDVFYNPNTDITTVLAHKQTLGLTNLLTQQTTRIPEGHTGRVQGKEIQDDDLIARPLEDTIQPPTKTEQTPEAQRLQKLVRQFEETKRARHQLGRLQSATSQTGGETAEPTAASSHVPQSSSETVPAITEEPASAGLNKTTMIAIGAGAVAAGGVTAIILSTDDGKTSEGPFTGTFNWEAPASNNSNWHMVYTFYLTQKGDSINGEFIQSASYCCTASVTTPVSGQLLGENIAKLTFVSQGAHCDCQGGEYGGVFPMNFDDTATLSNDGTVLMLSGWGIPFLRQ